MNSVDKRRVQRAFTRGAAAYEAHAHVQAGVVERLLALLPPASPPPRRILDVGAGTGLLLSRLSRLFPGAALAGVDLAPGMAAHARLRCPAAVAAVGDAERLPLASGAFDLVLSTSTLQWLPSLDRAFSEAGRVVAPGGLVAVAFFGEATLWELREAWRDALPEGAPDRTHRFHGEREVVEALARAGLERRLVRAERVLELHPTPLALLRALKRIGAGNAAGELGPSQLPRTGLGSRGTVDRMLRLYEARHGGPAGVEATWEVIYAVARRPP